MTACKAISLTMYLSWGILQFCKPTTYLWLCLDPCDCMQGHHTNHVPAMRHITVLKTYNLPVVMSRHMRLQCHYIFHVLVTRSLEMDKLVCHTQHSQPVHQKYVHIFITKLHFHHNTFIRKYILILLGLKTNTYTRLMTEDMAHKDWQKTLATKTDDRRHRPQRLMREDTGHKDWWQKAQATKTHNRRHRPQRLTTEDSPQRLTEDTGHRDWC